jgi:hypothetical protein
MGRPATITDGQREELWRRYKAGETILKIGRALGQRPTNIHRVLQASGGIAPVHTGAHPKCLVLVSAKRFRAASPQVTHFEL